MNPRMSSLVTRPPRPEPLTRSRVIPYFRASDLTNGDARFGAASGYTALLSVLSASADGASATRARALSRAVSGAEAATSAVRAGLADAAGTASDEAAGASPAEPA